MVTTGLNGPEGLVCVSVTDDTQGLPIHVSKMHITNNHSLFEHVSEENMQEHLSQPDFVYWGGGKMQSDETNKSYYRIHLLQVQQCVIPF